MPFASHCPLITFSNHLKYLTKQGFPGLLNIMNLIVHPLKQISRENTGLDPMTIERLFGCAELAEVTLATSE